MSSKQRTATTTFHDDAASVAQAPPTAAVDESTTTTRSSLIASPVLLNALNYAVAFAPVLIVMYVFSIMRSELSRIQARLDAMSVRVKNAPPSPSPYDDFQRFMANHPQEPPRRESSSHYGPPQQDMAPSPSPPPHHHQAEHRAVPVPPSWPQQQQPPQLPPQAPPQAPPPQPAAAMHVLSINTAADTPTAVVQLIPQMQPEGTKKSLPRLEELK
jgi:hypothetical protein